MLWSWAATVLVAAAIAAPPSIHWDYAPPWQPLNEPCVSCQQAAGSSRQARTLPPTFSHEDLLPGEARKLNPAGRTTIVKMASENFASSDKSSVQLVFIPEGRLSSLADRGLARMHASESKAFTTTVLPPPPATPQLSSDKQKRDHRRQVVTGRHSGNSFPMTLVAAEGKEDTAKEQLQLLETALSSHQATVSNEGQLPRVFIAPSNIPPPPGYVKIPLVPQKQAELRQNLPPTFLTHSNPNPLPPGFVRLSLPPSVSHLSKDIPLVESQRFRNTLSNNFITESPVGTNSVTVPQRNNLSRRPPPPPPTFDNRGNHEEPLQQLVNDKREASSQNFPQNKPNRINNEIAPNRFSNSGSPLPKIVSQEFPRQEVARFPPQQIQGFSNENNRGAEQSFNNNRDQARPTFNSLHSIESPQNNNRHQTPFREHTNAQPGQQRNERLPAHFGGNVHQQQQLKKPPPPLVINTNIPINKFEHQQRLQDFNRKQKIQSQNNNFNNQAIIQRQPPSNFPGPRPINNRGSSQRSTETQFTRPRPSSENPFPEQGTTSPHFPPSFNAPRPEQHGNGVHFSSNQNSARPSLENGDRGHPTPSLIPGAHNSNEFTRRPSKQSFVPLPNSVNQEQIQQFVGGSDLGSIESSSSRPSIFNTLRTSVEDGKQIVQNADTPFNLSPKTGIQVISKGEPKTQEQTISSPEPVVQDTSNFSPSVQSTTRRPQFSGRPSSNVLPIIGTPANVSFRERSKEFDSISRIPSSSNSQFQNENSQRNAQNSFPSNQRNGNFVRVNHREPVSSQHSGIDESNRHGGFLSSTELRPNNQRQPSQFQNVQPKPLPPFQQRETETSIKDSRPSTIRLQSNSPSNRDQNSVENRGNFNIPSPSSFENQFRGNSIPGSVAPRITTFSPVSVTPIRSTFSTTAQPPRRTTFAPHREQNGIRNRGNLNIPSPASFENQFEENDRPVSLIPRITTFSPLSVTPIRSTFSTTARPPIRTTFAPHVTSFSPPQFFQSSPVPIPNIVDNSVVDQDRPHSRERTSFSSLHTPRPFISNSDLPLLSSPRPHISTTPRPEIVTTFDQFPSTDPTFNQFSTTEQPPFTSTLHPNFDTTPRPFIQNTEIPVVDLDNVGPFKIQPFFNSFALPQPIRTGSGKENTQTISFSRPQIQSSNERLPFPTNLRGESQQGSISPSPVPIRNSQGSHGFEHTSPRTQHGSQEQFATTLSSFDLSTERPFTFSNEVRLKNKVRRPSQRFSSRNRDKIQQQPERIIPSPQRIDAAHDRVRSQSTITPVPTTTERKKNSGVKVTTFKPRIKFSFTKPTEKSVSVTESSAIQKTGEGATTLFPPFSEARRRQRVSVKDNDGKVEADVEEKTTRRAQPFIFGRRIRQRQQLRGETDQTSSGSNTRVSNTLSTAQPNTPRTRLNIAGRKRIRGRFRSTTSTTEAALAVEETDASENIQDSTSSPNEAETVETPVVTTGRRGSAVFKTRRQPASDNTQPQIRQRPGTRRVPQWLRDRRRRLRNKLRSTTTAKPVLDEIIDDPPIDFIDDNAFAAAESARVTFRRPSENSPHQEEHFNEPLTEENTESSPVITEIATFEDADQGTEMTKITQIEDATETVQEDSFIDEALPTTTEETAIQESELNIDYVDDTPLEREDVTRAALTSTKTPIPELSREYVDNTKFITTDRPTDDQTKLHTTRTKESFSTYYTPEAQQTETQPIERADWTSIIQTNSRQKKPAVQQYPFSFTNKHHAEDRVDRTSSIAPVATESDRTWEDKFEDLFVNEKHSSSFGDRIREGSAGKIYDGLDYTDYPQSEDHAFEESRTHIVYAVAPSEIVRVHQEKGDQDAEGTTDNIEFADAVEVITETIPEIELPSAQFDISSNDDFISTNSEAFRTVADGFRKAEETQKPAANAVETTEDVLTLAEVESTVMPGSTTATSEPPTERPGEVTEDLVGEADDAASVVDKDQSTVLGHSTVLEIRSSEPKVCFSNGKCITARNLKRR